MEMVDFGKLLSPEQRERIAAVQQEVERLYGLSDRWLGEALLKLARETRAEFPELAVNPHGLSYDANFVWHVVPEVAKRLGARNLRPNEGISPNVASMNDEALRCAVGAYLCNIAIDRMGMSVKGPRPTAAEILAHSLPNGNLVAFAVDRIAPAPAPGEDVDDWIARHIREISRARGLDETPYWSPAMQKPRSPSTGGDIADADLGDVEDLGIGDEPGRSGPAF